MEQGVFRFPGVVSEADRGAILAITEGKEAHAAGVYTAEGNNGTLDASRRDATVMPLDLPWLQERVWPLIHLANRAAGWDLPLQTPTQWQLATYGPGGHHDWHVDTEPPDFADRQGGLERKITLSMRLSPKGAYDGGAFEIQTSGTESVRTQLDDLGDTIIFPARLFHRVAPVTRGERQSLVMWVLGPRTS